MTSEDLRELWTAVWAFRAEMEDSFPTPGRDDSLAFAYTEGVGESLKALHGWPEKELDAAVVWASGAVDAELRQNSVYKRNNEKAHTIDRELTQCAMMLLTAVPSTFRAWGDLELFTPIAVWSVRNLALRVAHCLAVPSDIDYILQTVVIIGTVVNLSATLPAELNRMRAKHKTAAHNEPDPGDIVNWHSPPIRYPQRQEGVTLADYTEGSGVE
jgi:hypothetical protein